MVVVLFFWLQECMQSNLQKAHVLYARVEADEQARCLLQICSIHNVRPSDVMHLSPLEGGWERGVGHYQFSCTHALQYWIKALPWVTIKWLLNTIVDVLTGAFVESGLVLQKDQEHSLKVGSVECLWTFVVFREDYVGPAAREGDLAPNSISAGLLNISIEQCKLLVLFLIVETLSVSVACNTDEYNATS